MFLRDLPIYPKPRCGVLCFRLGDWRELSRSSTAVTKMAEFLFGAGAYQNYVVVPGIGASFLIEKNTSNRKCYTALPHLTPCRLGTRLKTLKGFWYNPPSPNVVPLYRRGTFIIREGALHGLG